MGRIREGFRGLVRSIPLGILVPVLLGGVLVAGYYAVRFVRFEYHYQAAGKALDREAFAEAGEHLATCLRIDPDSGRAHFRAARVARRSGQPEFALERLTSCADLGWPATVVNLERTMVAFQRGEFTLADEQTLQSHLVPDFPDRLAVLEALARGYLRTYRLQLALRCLDEWVAERPDSASARMQRGWVYERLDRFADAEDDYRHVVERDPSYRPAKLRLAQVLRHQNKAKEAMPLFEELSGAGDDPAVELGLAQCAVILGKVEEAERRLEELARTRPDDSAVLLARGKLAMAGDRTAQARDLLRRAVGAAPQNYEACYQYLLCLRKLKDPEAERVEKRLKEIGSDLERMGKLTDQLQREPNNPQLRLQIAELFLRRGEESEGALWLESVVQTAPSLPRAHELLAEHYERSGKPQKARAHREMLERIRQTATAPKP